MIEVESEEIEENSEEGAITVETEHFENLTAREFDIELCRRVAEVNDLAPSYVASRRNVMLDMSELSVEPGDFTDE